MLVRELVAHLLDLDQSLELWTANDDEGNGYRKLYYAPSVYYVDKNEGKHGYIDTVHAEEYTTDDPDEADWDKTFRGDLEAIVIVG